MSKLIDDLERIVDQDEQRLIDHFAGLAMNGILSAQVDKQGVGRVTVAQEAYGIATESYMIAKAMLEARKGMFNEKL